MAKPRRGKSEFPSPGGASPEGLPMENLQHMRIKQFEKLENRVARKVCFSCLVKIIEEQSKTISILEDKIAILVSHISQLHKDTRPTISLSSISEDFVYTLMELTCHLKNRRK